MRRRLAILVFVMLFGAAPVFLEGCGGEEHVEEDLTTATPVQTIKIELRDIAFSESRLEAGVDQVVDIEVKNGGTLDHDFTIERMAVDALVMGPQSAEHQGHGSGYAVHGAPGPGQTLTVRLHSHAAGEFTYFCTVKGHREAGMTGALVVR